MARENGSSVKAQLVPARRRTDAEIREMLQVQVTKAFRSLGERNPLKKLGDSDRMYLWSLLLIFTKSEGRSFKYLKMLDSVCEVARDAAELAERIENVLKVQHEETLARYLKPFGFLPVCLRIFAKRVGSLVDPMGTTGNKRRRAFEAQFLIEASEFVRHKTGTWNDEHLADLFQFVETDLSDLSGDVIHKRRERFKKEYPALYQVVVLRVRALFRGLK